MNASLPYLNSLSSLMTWMPWAYCSLVPFSPTGAKCWFIIREGADFWVLNEGRLSPLGCKPDGEAIMTEGGRQSNSAGKQGRRETIGHVVGGT